MSQTHSQAFGSLVKENQENTMAKINKNLKKEEVLKKKTQKKYNLKHLTVNLTRMTSNEYQIYSKSDQIIVKNFSLKITDNTLELGDTTKKSHTGTFNISIRKRLSELVMEHCEVLPKFSTVKSLNQLIEGAWRSNKKGFLHSERLLKVDDIVIAKMRGYPPWPGQLASFTKNKKRASVYFFGTHNTGSVDVTEIVPIEFCHEVIRLLLLRKMGEFYKAVAETEVLLKVPDNLSLLKEVEALK